MTAEELCIKKSPLAFIYILVAGSSFAVEQHSPIKDRHLQIIGFADSCKEYHGLQEEPAHQSRTKWRLIFLRGQRTRKESLVYLRASGWLEDTVMLGKVEGSRRKARQVNGQDQRDDENVFWKNCELLSKEGQDGERWPLQSLGVNYNAMPS